MEKMLNNNLIKKLLATESYPSTGLQQPFPADSSLLLVTLWQVLKSKMDIPK